MDRPNIDSLKTERELALAVGFATDYIDDLNSYIDYLEELLSDNEISY